MELGMKANGKKISNMAKVLKHGLMVLAMKVTMLMVKSMALVCLRGQMAALMMGNLLKTILKDKVKLSIFS
jgi:hypothetical protein